MFASLSIFSWLCIVNVILSREKYFLMLTYCIIETILISHDAIKIHILNDIFNFQKKAVLIPEFSSLVFILSRHEILEHQLIISFPNCVCTFFYNWIMEVLFYWIDGKLFNYFIYASLYGKSVKKYTLCYVF